MYKVLKREEGRLFSPFQHMEYEPNKTYTCENFCTDERQGCAEGFYATDVDGIIYSFRNLPGYEVWECEVGGDKVELDQFKRRYETIRLIRHVPNDEVKSLALAAEESVGYKLAEALFPVNVLKIKRTNPPTEEEIKWLKQWIAVRDSFQYSDSMWSSVRNSVVDSVGDSIWDSMVDSVGNSIWDSVRIGVGDSVGNSVWDSVWISVRNSTADNVWSSVWSSVADSVGNSVWDSVRNSTADNVWSSVWSSVADSVWESIWAYASSLFPNITKWKYINHAEGENPFQPAINLWKNGLIPSFDGKSWRLHAGENAEVVWKEVIRNEYI